MKNTTKTDVPGAPGLRVGGPPPCSPPEAPASSWFLHKGLRSGESAGDGEGMLGPPSHKVHGFPKAGRGLWGQARGGGGGGGAILAVSSGAEEAQMPHRRLPRARLCRPPAGPSQPAGLGQLSNPRQWPWPPASRSCPSPPRHSPDC